MNGDPPTLDLDPPDTTLSPEQINVNLAGVTAARAALRTARQHRNDTTTAPPLSNVWAVHRKKSPK